MARIGVGIVTFERFDRFKECFDNLLKNSEHIDEVLIVDDCSTKDKEKYDTFFDSLLLPKFKVIVNDINSGVGVSKNKILNYFYNKDFDYIFTLEDDINVLNPNVFNKYIECSIKTNFTYINFGLHNIYNYNNSETRIINGIEVSIYPELSHGFTLHTKELIDKIGYYDENYNNSYESIDYYYRAAKEELTAPFWMFIDIKDSDKYLEEQYNSIQDSTTKSSTKWIIPTTNGAKYFYKKFGVSINEIPRI